MIVNILICKIYIALDVWPTFLSYAILAVTTSAHSRIIVISAFYGQMNGRKNLTARAAAENDVSGKKKSNIQFFL